MIRAAYPVTPTNIGSNAFVQYVNCEAPGRDDRYTYLIE